MAAKHFDSPRPAQLPGRTLPIPYLPGAMLREKASVSDLSKNALLHQKILAIASTQNPPARCSR